MPNSFIAASFVDTATHCAATAALPPAASSHSRTAVALTSVSWVVNVFEQITNNVVSAFTRASTCASATPSTFETKWTFKPRRTSSASACTAITMPRSDPPMPMLTMSVIGLPVKPRS